MTGTPPRTHSTAPAAQPDGGGLFARSAVFAHRHRWTALVLWAVVLAGTWAAASSVGDRYRDDYSIPGTETQRTVELLEEHGSGQGGGSLEIVLHDPDGLRGKAVRRAVGAMEAKVADLPAVDEVRGAFADRSSLSPDGTTAFATVTLDRPAEEMEVSDTRRILETARTVAGDGVRVELGGEAAGELAADSGGAAEGAGILAALLILVFMFGTVVAAGLPVITALFAVGTTLGAIVLVSHLFTVATWAPYVMMLVGLGVGIDYALLVFARYRTELTSGAETAEAARRALQTAGRTVAVAGCTVIIALLGLVALGLGALRGAALAVALTILVTMLASLTLLPALLAVFGKRFERQFRARAAKRAERGKSEEGAGWRRLGAAVQRRPVAVLVLAVVALGALAAPMLGMRLGFADAGNDPQGSTSRKAYDRLADGFGPGVNGPLVIAVAPQEGGSGGDVRAAARSLTTELRDTPGIAGSSGVIPTADGEAATVLVYPKTAPQDEATTDLVHHLRGEVLPGLSERTGADYLLGGATASVIDYSDTVASRMPLFVAIVVGLSMLLLAAVFRSLLIPLKAALLNLLSIGAALGAITLVFQNGWLGEQAGPIEAYLPVMIFAIVFGLSMDYEVFLLSRMREEWLRTGDHTAAVREGLARTGAVVTAAGAIMIVVFGSFFLSDDRMLRQFGFGLAVAIFMDAVVIRCLLVPAVLRLLGPRAWWLPRPVERILPRLDID
ncbi:MMPL family transporter [Streptomyces qinglanensis]|uniref:Putative drug exporter of the RND superfamily n=1 Tax=Streptomyces qinglanensis TaxID=943816 RepID=A0A1H9N9H5_9ACTN|nr:MMPL family transporter [Streptomyces qinglanensis]SER32397.1 putative drug exporter of the RND superfamily [Streptomyces qinglanensis]